MQDIAVGIAQVADELIRANSDGHGCSGSPAREFVFQFVHAMPEHDHISLTTPVARPAGKPNQVAQSATIAEADDDAVEAMAPIARLVIASDTIVTTAGLIDQWLDAKGGLSRAERSRQGSSARLFVEAVGLTDAAADRLAEISANAAHRFAQYATGFPLTARGERTRIAHIKSFIAFAQGMHIAVPDQDWTHVHN